MKCCTLVSMLGFLGAVFFCPCDAGRLNTSDLAGKPPATSWTVWSPCVFQRQNCGNGTQRRSLICNNNTLLRGGVCKKAQEIRNCSLPCPVNGNWTEWLEWGVCSTTCGNGTQRRYRTCTYPTPTYGGQNCTGESEQSRACHVPCPVDGNWTSWGNWSDCYPSCGNGHRTRTRHCTDPAPAHRGRYCTGQATELQSCYLNPCPGDCDFDNGFCAWKNVRGDTFDWTLWKGRTKSSQTGPYMDHTTTTGYYVYTEASFPRRKGDTAKLFSPPLTGVWCMRFFFNMFGRGMGDLQVFLHHEDVDLETFVWGRYKDQGLGWHSSNATVYGFNGKSFNISFVSRIGNMYMSDMALDDISFVPGTCNGEILDFLNTNRTKKKPEVVDIAKKKGEPGTCHFDSLKKNLCGWINEPVEDNMDWHRISGSTMSKDTGPSFDHSTGVNGTGNYLHIEASSVTPGWKARLLSPRLCGRNCFQFYYHMYGRDIGKLNIYHRHGLGVYDKVWSAGGNHGDRWLEALITFNGDCYQIVVEGTVTNGFYGDIAFDDVFISKGSCCALDNRLFDAGREGNCSFDNGLGHWQHKKNGVDFQWSIRNGSTPSPFTGPSADFSGLGQYAYIESSEPRMIGHKASIISKVFRGLQCMSFMYHMYGETVGSLTVYRFGNGLTKIQMWKTKGNQGDQWNHAAITFQCNVTSYQVEFEATVGGWTGDIAIDKIEFTPGKCPKGALTSADVPKPTPTQSSSFVGDVRGNCTFPGHFCGWKNAENNNFDWLLHSGPTETDDTGPSGDYDKGGYYLYTEASLAKHGDTARLTSEFMAGQQCMEFYFHMAGNGIGELFVEKIGKSKTRNRILWSKHGSQGFRWRKAAVNVHGKSYMIRIVSVRGKTFAGDIAIDTISFSPGRCSGVPSQVPVVGINNNKVPAHALVLDDCNFDQGFCKWKNTLEDDFDWKLRRGRTPSGGTGPDRDHSGRGQYVFIETSTPQKPFDKARLLRYGSGEACMTFFYHMYGSDIGSLIVYQNIHGVDIQLWRKDKNLGKQWWKAEVQLKVASSYQIILEGIRGKDYRGDIAIDDISFIKGSCSIPVRQYRI